VIVKLGPDQPAENVGSLLLRENGLELHDVCESNALATLLYSD